jgi:hypothetical protein
MLVLVENAAEAVASSYMRRAASSGSAIRVGSGLAMLAKLLPRDRWKVFLVTPSMLLRWQCELARRHWTYPATGRQHGLDPAVVELVPRLARDNARWVYANSRGVCQRSNCPRASAYPSTSTRRVRRSSLRLRHSRCDLPASTAVACTPADNAWCGGRRRQDS